MNDKIEIPSSKPIKVIPIYPFVNIELNTWPEHLQLVLETNVRMKHEGKYYLWNYKFDNLLDKEALGLSLLQRSSIFYMTVYNMITFGKVDLGMLHPMTNTPVFELDPEQRSEEKMSEELLNFCKY